MPLYTYITLTLPWATLALGRNLQGRTQRASTATHTCGYGEPMLDRVLCPKGDKQEHGDPNSTREADNSTSGDSTPDTLVGLGTLDAVLGMSNVPQPRRGSIIRDVGLGKDLSQEVNLDDAEAAVRKHVASSVKRDAIIQKLGTVATSEASNQSGLTTLTEGDLDEISDRAFEINDKNKDGTLDVPEFNRAYKDAVVPIVGPLGTRVQEEHVERHIHTDKEAFRQIVAKTFQKVKDSKGHAGSMEVTAGVSTHLDTIEKAEAQEIEAAAAEKRERIRELQEQAAYKAWKNRRGFFSFGPRQKGPKRQLDTIEEEQTAASRHEDCRETMPKIRKPDLAEAPVCEPRTDNCPTSPEGLEQELAQISCRLASMKEDESKCQETGEALLKCLNRVKDEMLSRDADEKEELEWEKRRVEILHTKAQTELTLKLEAARALDEHGKQLKQEEEDRIARERQAEEDRIARERQVEEDRIARERQVEQLKQQTHHNTKEWRRNFFKYDPKEPGPAHGEPQQPLQPSGDLGAIREEDDLSDKALGLVEEATSFGEHMKHVDGEGPCHPEAQSRAQALLDSCRDETEARPDSDPIQRACARIKPAVIADFHRRYASATSVMKELYNKAWNDCVDPKEQDKSPDGRKEAANNVVGRVREKLDEIVGGCKEAVLLDAGVKELPLQFLQEFAMSAVELCQDTVTQQLHGIIRDELGGQLLDKAQKELDAKKTELKKKKLLPLNADAKQCYDEKIGSETCGGGRHEQERCLLEQADALTECVARWGHRHVTA